MPDPLREYVRELEARLALLEAALELLLGQGDIQGARGFWRRRTN